MALQIDSQADVCNQTIFSSAVCRILFVDLYFSSEIKETAKIMVISAVGAHASLKKAVSRSQAASRGV